MATDQAVVAFSCYSNRCCNYSTLFLYLRVSKSCSPSCRACLYLCHLPLPLAPTLAGLACQSRRRRRLGMRLLFRYSRDLNLLLFWDMLRCSRTLFLFLALSSLEISLRYFCSSHYSRPIPWLSRLPSR